MAVQIQKRSALPINWIGAAVLVLAVIAAGFYWHVRQRQAPPPRLYQVELSTPAVPAPAAHPDRAAAANAPASATAPAAVPYLDSNFAVQDFRAGPGNQWMEGALQNKTDRKYSFVQVEVDLYDQNGKQVGSTITNVNGLAPHARWHFRVPVVGKDAADARIVHITAY